MQVLYPRRAGLDVHKDTVVARIRRVSDSPSGPRMLRVPCSSDELQEPHYVPPLRQGTRAACAQEAQSEGPHDVAP
jgi:hypothetical protein